MQQITIKAQAQPNLTPPVTITPSKPLAF